jgi:hypothetical protein
MPMTPMERTFLKGGRNPHQGIKSNPYQVKPVAKPMGFSQGAQWKGPLSINEKLNANAGKWLSKDPTTKSGFAKDRPVARSFAGGGGKPFSYKGLPSPNVKDLAKGYFNFRKMLAPWEMLMYPGTAMAPSAEEMGFEPQPTIWYNEGPTGRYRRQDG